MKNTIYTNKLLTATIFLCASLSILLKWYFFNEYGTFSNDDHAYIGMATHIFSNLLPTTDGFNPHTLFPPGYPLILSIEKIIIGRFF